MSLLPCLDYHTAFLCRSVFISLFVVVFLCVTVPTLPQRQWTPQAQAGSRISTGHIGLVCLGCSLVTKIHDGIAHLGMVASYQRPFFRVHYYDGSSEDLTGDEIAAGLRLSLEQVQDPRRWMYDWSTFNPTRTPDFRAHIASYVRAYGFHLPPSWTGIQDGGSAHVASSSDSIDDFLRKEALWLEGRHKASMSEARAPTTLANYKNPVLKLAWFALSRRWAFPPTAEQFGLYLTKLRETQNNAGALTTAKNALSCICQLNGVDSSQYNALSVSLSTEGVLRAQRHIHKKSAALTAGLLRKINAQYSFLRPHRASNAQWEFAFGAAISAAFKLLARHSDMVRLLWDDNMCTIRDSHVQFYLSGRKNLQHGSAILDVARPADNNPDGVYFLLCRAKDHFRTGHVLPHINRTTGEVNNTKSMSYNDYVLFLRSALVTAGVPAETASLFAGQSPRAGGASEAAASGLHHEDIQHLAGVTSPEWLTWYNRRLLDERLRVSRALGL